MPPSRHWLDPMARRVLQLMGELPPDQKPPTCPEPAAAPWRIDVNRALEQDWLLLPGCTIDQAQLLVRLQQGGVQLSSCEDLERLLQLPPAQIEIWRPHLLFRWYSTPPLAEQPQVELNSASDAQLTELGLSEARRQRLRRERLRAPFRDLADLQQRLMLPPDVVEGLIGRICFGPANKVCPELPRTA